MHSIFALSGWCHKFNLKKVEVCHLGLVFWWTKRPHSYKPSVSMPIVVYFVQLFYLPLKNITIHVKMPLFVWVWLLVLGLTTRITKDRNWLRIPCPSAGEFVYWICLSMEKTKKPVFPLHVYWIFGLTKIIIKLKQNRKLAQRMKDI